MKPSPISPDRRTFLATAAATLLPAAAQKQATSETLVASLYKSLSAEQRKVICFPFGHALQSQVDNNWHITPTKISLNLTDEKNDQFVDETNRLNVLTHSGRQFNFGLRYSL